jgi:hypothetical protein
MRGEGERHPSKWFFSGVGSLRIEGKWRRLGAKL